MVIAESHYLPNGSTAHLSPEEWYNGDDKRLDSTEKSWIATSDIVRYSGNRIFNNIYNALIESGIDSDGAKEQIFFMNYFQRPAIEKRSFKNVCTQLDKDEADKNLRKVISILKPDLIIFVSKYAVVVAEETELWKFTNTINCIYTYTNHPSTVWWNKATRPDFFKGRTSKEHFKFFLKENKFIID
ncbi:MAG: hypothetical protein CR982_09655 [Candidatus Cloacimonadota bacterium]|nr:MAG: hypothetical protein CR982_09655 [Candidatus Cloacimonadota bacterium]PIE78175.1 MAG: hypothetical protein CSA15_08970 [Candidatus Delongbacteria bacterium]